MKPTDLDDLTPVEPDDDVLARVHTRSGSFRRRRNAQRLMTAATGVLVVSLAVGVASARLNSGDSRVTGPATTTTVAPPAITTAELSGRWTPVSIAGYDGPLSDPPLSWVPRLTFETDETFSGSDGCNDVSGTYRLGPAGSFDVRNHFSTLVGCRQTLPLLDVLYAATRVGVVDNRLTLFADDGRELASFARAAITARLELPSDTITAGSSVKGSVVVENNTGQPVHASGCVSYFEVLLINDDVQQDPSWLDCLQQFTFPVGESTHPITVSASYNFCATSSDQSQFESCLPNNDPPPVPPGDYRATLFQSGDAVAAPPPLTVHVVDPDEAAANFAAEDLRRELSNAGYHVTPDGTTAGGVLDAETRVLCASGTQVRVQEYADEAARRAVSDGIQPDGYEIRDGNRHTMVDWIGPPHFFARGRVLVLVLQDDGPLLRALSGIMGPTISPGAPPNDRAKAACA